MRDRAEPEPQWRVRERGAGDLATVVEIDVELALALGVGRRRDGVPFVGESAGVERREADCVRWVRDEVKARSVIIDAESELTNPLGYGDGRDSERAEGIGLPEGTGGGGVRERSLSPGRRGRGTLGGEGASATVLGHGAGVPIRKCHSWGMLERTRERPGGGHKRVLLMSSQSTVAAIGSKHRGIN
jgi:hypothetical protein